MFNLKDIIGLARKPANARDEVVAALEALDVAAAKRKVEDLEAERRRILVSGDDAALADIENKILAADREIARAIAMTEEFRTRLSKLDDRATEQAREEAYRVALAERGRAEKALKKYPAAAKAIVELLAEVASADRAIELANGDLPAGAEPILSAEQIVRGLPGEDRHIVSEEPFTEWHYENGGAAVDPRDVEKIVSDDGSTGRLEIISRNGGGIRTFRVVRRNYARQTFIEARDAYRPASLAASINLPGLLPGQLEIWYPFEDSAARMLARIQDAKSEWSHPASDPRQPRSTFTRVVPGQVTE